MNHKHLSYLAGTIQETPKFVFSHDDWEALYDAVYALLDGS